MMVVADDPRDLPFSIFVLPDLNELPLADRLHVVPPRVMEAVDNDLDRTIAVQGIHRERSWNELPAHLAADVLLDTLDQALPCPVRQPAVIVVELQLFREERAELLQVASVIGVEDFGVQRRDRAKELVIRRRAWPRLSVCPDYQRRE